MINEVDVDGSGEIEFDEFLLLIALKMKDVDEEDEFKDSFKVFDREGKGYFTLDEFIS